MKRKILEKKSYTYKEAEEFDAKFWKRAGVQARFAAAWLMLIEYYKMRGKSGVKLRLRKSVQNIKWL